MNRICHSKDNFAGKREKRDISRHKHTSLVSWWNHIDCIMQSEFTCECLGDWYTIWIEIQIFKFVFLAFGAVRREWRGNVFSFYCCYSYALYMYIRPTRASRNAHGRNITTSTTSIIQELWFHSFQWIFRLINSHILNGIHVNDNYFPVQFLACVPILSAYFIFGSVQFGFLFIKCCFSFWSLFVVDPFCYWLKCNFGVFTKCKWNRHRMLLFHQPPQMLFVFECTLESPETLLLSLLLMKIFLFRWMKIFRHFCWFFFRRRNNLFMWINFACRERAKLKYKITARAVRLKKCRFRVKHTVLKINIFTDELQL